MRNFLFMLGVAAGDLVSIASVKLYESADGQAVWVEVDAVAVGALVDDPGGKKRWDSAAADPTQYAKLVAVSASGVERPDGILRPPLPVDPDTFTVFIYTENAGLGIVKGLPFSAVPAPGFAVVGEKVVVASASTQTDDVGFAELPLRSGAGSYTLSLGPLTGTIDTADKTGQVINVKDAGWSMSL